MVIVSPRVDEKRPRVDARYLHAASGWRFRAFQSSMLRYAAADNLADRAGVHPNPHVLYEAILEVRAPCGARALNVRTLDVLGGMRLSWRREGGAVGTALSIDPKRAGGDGEGPRRVLFQHLPHTLRRNDVFCGDTQENAWDACDYALLAGLPSLAVPKSQHASRWHRSRAEFNTNSKNCRPFETDSDWTYTVSAMPRVTLRDATSTRYGESCLPMHLLADRTLPILFHSSLTYFEDELEDSGNSNFQLRLRVHDQFFFLLVRGEVRVDNVLARRCDTRFFGNLGAKPISLPGAADGGPAALPPGAILREWSYEEVTFARLRERGDLRGTSQIQDVGTMFRQEDLRHFAGTVFSS